MIIVPVTLLLCLIENGDGYTKRQTFNLVVTVYSLLCFLNQKGSRTYHYSAILFCVCVCFLADPQHNYEWERRSSSLELDLRHALGVRHSFCGN